MRPRWNFAPEFFVLHYHDTYYVFKKTNSPSERSMLPHDGATTGADGTTWATAQKSRTPSRLPSTAGSAKSTDSRTPSRVPSAAGSGSGFIGAENAGPAKSQQIRAPSREPSAAGWSKEASHRPPSRVPSSTGSGSRFVPDDDEDESLAGVVAGAGRGGGGGRVARQLMYSELLTRPGGPWAWMEVRRYQRPVTICANIAAG